MNRKKNTKLQTVEEEIYKEIADTLELPVSLVKDMVENGQSPGNFSSSAKGHRAEMNWWKRLLLCRQSPT